MKKYVIFDMDGTILNTLEDLTDSVNYCLMQFSLPVRTIDEIKSFVGDGIPKLIERAVPGGTAEAMTAEVYALMLKYYKTHCEIKTAPYEGIVELMAELKRAGLKLAVVTNKEESAALELASNMFGGYLDVVIGAKEGRRTKPHPDGVLDAMSILGAEDRSEVVFIGDSDVDIMTAKNAGLDCIGVLWGFRDRAVLEAVGADSFAQSPQDIFKALVK